MLEQNQKFAIKSLELVDFMKFKHRVFNFAEDLSIVVGPNGTGKSAILEALALSFQIKDRGSSVHNYIRHGKNVATVKLNCMWLGKQLTIESSFARSGARRIHRVVTYNGESFEDTQANNYLLEFFDNKSLVVAFALQGNEKFLTNSKSANLRNLINLLQLDFSKELWYTKERIQSLEKEKTRLLEEFNKQQGIKETYNRYLNQAKQQLVLLEESLKKDQEKPDLDIAAIDKQIFEIQNSLQSLLQVKNETAANLVSLNTAKQNLASSEEELLNVTNRLQSLDCEAKPQDRNGTVEKINQISQSLQELQNKLKEATAESNNVFSKLTVLRTNQKFELDRKQQLLTGTCPTCLQKIPQALSLDLDARIQTIEKDLAELEKDLENSKQQATDIEKDIQRKSTEQSLANSELSEIDRKNVEIQHNQALKEQLLKSKNLLQKNVETCKDAVKQAKAKYNESAQDNSQEISVLTTKLKNLTDQKSQEKDRLESLHILASKVADCKTSISDYEQNIASTEKSIKETEQQVANIQQNSSNWTKAQEVFSLLPKLHLQTFINDIQSICSSIAVEFGYKGMRLESDEKGLTYILQDWPQDDVDAADTPYEMCSAFEKNLVNLSLVYALSRMFRVPFVCIDELDASADTENTAKLGDLVKLILQYTPVVTVSHDTGLVGKLLQSNYKVSILKTIEEEKQ